MKLTGVLWHDDNREKQGKQSAINCRAQKRDKEQRVVYDERKRFSLSSTTEVWSSERLGSGKGVSHYQGKEETGNTKLGRDSWIMFRNTLEISGALAVNQRIPRLMPTENNVKNRTLTLGLPRQSWLLMVGVGIYEGLDSVYSQKAHGEIQKSHVNGLWKSVHWRELE